MRVDPRWIVIFATNALLAFLGDQLNHELAPWTTSCLVAGLFVPVAALRLRFRAGLLALLLSCLLFDAARPVYFGSTAIILGTAYTVWQAVRPRTPREGNTPAVLGGLLVNAVLFLLQPLVLDAPSSGSTFARAAWDLLCSEVAVLVVGPWFFALQERTLQLCGVNLAEEARERGT